MIAEMKLSVSRYLEILTDLRRPHQFALERVGFCTVRQSFTENRVILLIDGYFPVADEHYIYDSHIGARIGEPALTKAIHLAYHGRGSNTGVFHVHLHDHLGVTGLSREDKSSIPKVVNGLQQINCDASHGLIIFSANHAHAQLLLPNEEQLTPVDVVSVIGPKLLIFKNRRLYV